MFDFVFLAIVLVSSWLGFSHGAIVDLARTIIFFVAVVGGLLFGPWLGDLVFGADGASQNPWSMPIGFLVFFIVVYLIGGFVRRKLLRVVVSSEMGATDQMIGLVLGFARGALIVLIVIACIMKWGDSPIELVESASYQMLEPFHSDVRKFVDFVASD